MDQQGSGVLRTLACVCKGREDLLCPYHSLRRVVRLQLQRFGFVTLDDVPLAYLPLFGQKEDPSLPVTKVACGSEGTSKVGGNHFGRLPKSLEV